MHLQIRDLYIIAIGFIILGLGIALLNPGESTSFFIFPFFFAGDLAPFLMLATLFVMMMCFWQVNRSWREDERFLPSQEAGPVFLRVGSKCQFCASPIPENAGYCPMCGNPVERQYGEEHSF